MTKSLKISYRGHRGESPEVIDGQKIESEGLCRVL
jgi:hypothetical protein